MGENLRESVHHGMGERPRGGDSTERTHPVTAAEVNLHVFSNIEVQGQYAGLSFLTLKLKLSVIKS